jgi:hypothetical protein
MAIPAVIGAGSSLFSGISGRNAAKAAGTRQANAGEDTINYLNARQAEGNQGIDRATGTATSWVQPATDYAGSLQMPYIHGGEQAETQLSTLLAQPVDKFSYDPSQVANDPGYQFTLAQGQKALEQSAAARGQSLSGGQLKALSQFNQGNAATYENQFYNQALNTFDTNRDTLQQRIGNLFGQTSQGQQSATTVGTQQIQGAEYGSNAEQTAAALKANLGLQYSGQYGNAQTGSANTTAASILAANNQMTGGVTNATNDIGQAIFLNQLMKKPPTSATSNYDGSAVVRPGDDLQFGG